ncbi:SDR family NAD(P)-dependent oxidoreductase [Pendulispora brunnea]|uniref:SDR family NAD(P)-dependent oxidoreductase n=1 Tax=Pendulispora brunnea TaxID=2905690 RepID=A0ABZ2KTA9_9BACT
MSNDVQGGQVPGESIVEESPSVQMPVPVPGRLLYDGGLQGLMDTAAKHTSKPGIVFVQPDDSENVLSYEEVRARAIVRLGALQRAGLKEGDRALLLTGDSAQFIVDFWACVYGGIVPAPLIYPSSLVVMSEPLRKMAAVWDQLGRPTIIGDSAAAAQESKLQELVGAPDCRILALEELEDAARPGEIRPLRDLDRVAFIQYSSGSTGRPKGVMLTHRNLLTNLEGIVDALELTEADVFLGWMPYFHDMGLIGFHFTPLAMCIKQVNLSPLRFVKYPLKWLEKMHQHRATISGSPNFGYQRVLDRVSPADLQGLDLSCVRAIVNGAEPISWRVMKEFQERLACCGLHENAVQPVYGMAEACLAVTFSPIGSHHLRHSLDRKQLARHGAVVDIDGDGDACIQIPDEGVPVGGVGVRIVDEHDRVLPQGRVGHIQIHGENVTRGYFENPEANAALFAEGTWLRTGDIGFMRHGRLSVTGRAKDIIFVNGQNFFAFDVEECAAAVPGVAEGKVVAVGWHDDKAGCERVALFVGTAGGGTPRESVYRAVVERVLDVMGILVDYVVPLKQLPKTTSGKVQRYRMLQDLLDGKYADAIVGTDALMAPPPAATPNEPVLEPEALLLTVRRVAAEILRCPIDRVLPESGFRSLGGTSLKAVDFLSKLEETFRLELPQRVLFECRNIAAVADFIGREAARAAAEAAQVASEETSAPEAAPSGGEGDIAIIALGGRFPGSATIDEFWSHVLAGESAVTDVPPSRWDSVSHADRAGAPQRGGFLTDPYVFDYALFGISREEALGMDPQQRLFLEVAWETLERGGYLGRRVQGRRVGVFVGASYNNYLEYFLQTLRRQELSTFDSVQRLAPSERAALDDEWIRRYGDMNIRPESCASNILNMIASRTSHVFNLRGPSLTVDTACSASLVSVHLACESLRRGECEMALAGGVNLLLTPTSVLLLGAAGALSPSGVCRVFDASADGLVPGEGAGAVLLKPLARALEDGDEIMAVIKGSAINNDGASLGVMTPNPDGQRDVIGSVYERFGLNPRDVQYLEAHGTGTAIGDPIEVRALAQVFSQHTAEAGYCAIGSVKSNIGHLLTAAGIAGLIKVVLALRARKIPPTLNVDTPNPRIRFPETPFFVAAAAKDWERRAGAPRCAAINSFGFGGTNCHLVVEEAPPAPEVSPAKVTASPSLACFSAHSEEALRLRATQLADDLEQRADADVSDVCFTVNTRSAQLGVRAGLVASSRADFIEKLRGVAAGAGRREASRPPRVVLMFTGQGSQYPGMGKTLYEKQPAFRRFFDEVAGHFGDALGAPLQELVFGKEADPARLAQTALTQPATFAIDYAVGRLLLHWGLEPVGMLGHSVGEYVAACLGGVIALPDAARIVLERGRLMGQLETSGAMAAIFASPDRVSQWLEPYTGKLWIAALNGSHQVVSGHEADIVSFLADVHRHGARGQRLKTSQAFHTPLLEPMLAEFRRVLAPIAFQRPAIPILSNVTAQWIRDAAPNAEYWIEHAMSPVRFEPSIRAAVAADCNVFVEAGPDRTLTALSRAILGPEAMALPTLQSKVGNLESLLGTLASLFERGCELDFDAFEAASARRRVSLPAYPLIRERLHPMGDASHHGGAGGEDARWQRWLHVWNWVPSKEVPKQPSLSGPVLVFGDAGAHRDMHGAVLVVAGSAFSESSDGVFTVDPRSQEDWARVLSTLAGRGTAPGAIVHLLALADADRADTAPCLESDRALVGLVSLAKALVTQRASSPPLLVVTAGACPVESSSPRPMAAAVVAMAQTIGLEESGLDCRAIDIDAATAERLRDVVTAELGLPANDERLAVWRAGKRLTRELVHHRTESDATSLIEPNDTYLLVGGATGIGAEVALELARRAKVNLVITGRTPSTDPSRLALVRALEELGARALYLEADACEPDAMARAVGAAREQFGAFRGVIYCAGIVDKTAARLTDKTHESIASVLRPKMLGVIVTDLATREEPLKFFVTFSSVAATSARWSRGLGDYAAANAFLDQYCVYRDSVGARGNSMAINWSLWEGRGMGTIAGIDSMTRRSGLLPLAPEVALRALFGALGQRTPVLHVLDRASTRTVAPRPVLAVPSAKAYTERPISLSADDVRKLVLEVVAEHLQTSAGAIDASRPFRELGLDSVSAVSALSVLSQRLGRTLYPTLMFEFETPEDLTAYLVGLDGAPPPTSCRVEREDAPRDRDIAIVGMACRVPGADDLDAFWDMLVQGRSAIGEAPRDRFSADAYAAEPAEGTSHTSYSKWGGFISEPYAFDAMFFGISPREATSMDPQQRVFLEVAWQAMQQAGYGSKRPADTGVFVGCETNYYAEHFMNHQRFELLKNEFAQSDWWNTMGESDRADLVGKLREALAPAHIEADAVPGNGLNHIAARVSHFMDLKGPAMVVNTACSSALVALHWACESLRSGETSMAIVGGVYLNIGTTSLVFLSQLKALSPDGTCSPFDKRANGMVLGEGVGALVLKPLRQALADGDVVHAVIKGSAINNDGHSQGITVPTASGQAEAIRRAHANARIDPSTVSYIECHGTGTPLGDPVEVQGLALAFPPPADGTPDCAVGSVKASIGHLLAASGIPSIIKTVLAFQHRVIPPSAGYRELNPHITLTGTRFHVAEGRARNWDSSGPRRAGVNGFGFGGTNCHVVLEEAPPAQKLGADAAGPHLLHLSARTPEALRRVARTLLDHRSRHPEQPLPALIASMNRGQRSSAAKAAAVVRDARHLEQLLLAIEAGTSAPGLHLGRSNPRRSTPVWIWPGENTSPGDVEAWVRFLQEAGITPAGTVDERTVTSAQRDAVLQIQGGNDRAAMLEALARLCVQGVALDFEQLHAGIGRLPIPGYPFERTTYRAFVPDPALAPVQPVQPPPSRSISESQREATHALIASSLQDWAAVPSFEP